MAKGGCASVSAIPYFADYFNNLILNGFPLRGDNKGKKGTSMLPTYSLSGMTIVTPAEIIRNGRVKIEKNRIKSLRDAAKFNMELEAGTFCYPALILVAMQKCARAASGSPSVRKTMY